MPSRIQNLSCNRHSRKTRLSAKFARLSPPTAHCFPVRTRDRPGGERLAARLCGIWIREFSGSPWSFMVLQTTFVSKVTCSSFLWRSSAKEMLLLDCSLFSSVLESYCSGKTTTQNHLELLNKIWWWCTQSYHIPRSNDGLQSLNFCSHFTYQFHIRILATMKAFSNIT